MRLLTGPVCIVDQTAPKTTPRPTPRDASRMRDVRTQLAPARAGRVRGGGARGAAMACNLLQRLGVVFERVRVCGVAAAAPPAAASWAWLLNEAAATANSVSMASADEKVKSGSFKGSG